MLRSLLNLWEKDHLTKRFIKNIKNLKGLQKNEYYGLS